MKSLGVPHAGCFAASYPEVQWHATQCKAAPHLRYAPTTRSSPETVGNGTDYSAVVSGSISSATGSFPSVSAGSTEYQVVNGNQVANDFSLQLNTAPFTSPMCSGPGIGSGCKGWQQFVYATSVNEIFIQDWLLGYDTTCPADWTQYQSDCYRNTAASPWNGPAALTVADLASVQLTGIANAGDNDTVIMTATSGFATAESSSDTLGLANNWNTAEFDVFGNANSSEAVFSPGTSISTSTAINDGSATAPTCAMEGFTGETNNLNMAPTAAIGTQAFPTTVSDQTYSAQPTPSCADVVSASGSTVIPDSDITNFTPVQFLPTMMVPIHAEEMGTRPHRALDPILDRLHRRSDSTSISTEPTTHQHLSTTTAI